MIVAVQSVQKLGQGAGLWEIPDGIPTRIRAQLAQHPRVVVAQSTQVVLLCPIFFPVPNAKMHQHRRFKLQYFTLLQSMAITDFSKNGFDFRFGVILSINLLQAMIGYLRTHAGKKVMPLFQGIQKMVEVIDGGIRCFFQARYVLVEGLWIVYRHCLIGAEGGQYPYVEATLRNLSMELQVVDRIIGRTEHLDVHLTQ